LFFAAGANNINTPAQAPNLQPPSEIIRVPTWRFQIAAIAINTVGAASDYRISASAQESKKEKQQ